MMRRVCLSIFVVPVVAVTQWGLRCCRLVLGK